MHSVTVYDKIWRKEKRRRHTVSLDEVYKILCLSSSRGKLKVQIAFYVHA